ncbi:conserved hypothetical protein [Streptomyces sviceus ATCC 29083]|uniref:Uncharacterized protein n=1 Tax=Streptomyces sviceus (strain ATCC 29083 / DSM 924 / JCM 4929 / NBRC 13980 / NCIMB 11184 / NRRL 5439 / UC 5370) TaxID=463191 RepID=B5HUL9_STRX2|nr:conserved hypothetical protein [Streptomyces sviceus ATCC 29083]
MVSIQKILGTPSRVRNPNSLGYPGAGLRVPGAGARRRPIRFLARFVGPSQALSLGDSAAYDYPARVALAA